MLRDLESKGHVLLFPSACALTWFYAVSSAGEWTGTFSPRFDVDIESAFDAPAMLKCQSQPVLRPARAVDGKQARVN